MQFFPKIIFIFICINATEDALMSSQPLPIAIEHFWISEMTIGALKANTEVENLFYIKI